MAKKASLEKYPHHARLKAVKDKTQFAADFLEFLERKGYWLFTSDGKRGLEIPKRDDFLYEFIGVDRWKLEDEKKAMLDEATTWMQERNILPKKEKESR